MATVTMKDVEQVLSRRVKSDGRAGGLQRFAGRDVDVIIYENKETVSDTYDPAEEEEGN